MAGPSLIAPSTGTEKRARLHDSVSLQKRLDDVAVPLHLGSN